MNTQDLTPTITPSENYVGYIGWSGRTTHAINVEECTCPKFEGTHSHREAYALCSPNLGQHYRMGQARVMGRNTIATRHNINCRNCIKRLEQKEQ